MFISQLLTNIFFRILNFGIVIGIAAYSIKRYLLPVIHSMMTKQEAEREYLLSQHTILENQQAELDELMSRDNALCESFKLKVDEWKRISEHEQKIREKKRADLCHAYMDKNRKKQQIIEQDRLHALMAVRVVDELEQSLTTYFHTDEIGDEYLDNVIQRIQER